MAEINNTNAFTNISNKQKSNLAGSVLRDIFVPFSCRQTLFLQSYHRQTSRAIVTTFYTIHITLLITGRAATNNRLIE